MIEIKNIADKKVIPWKEFQKLNNKDRIIEDMATTSHMAVPARVTPSPTPSKRGHTRSASLENANSFVSKNTLGLPIVQAGHTGTLKSRNEQKRLRNKFGSHSNLEDFVQQGRAKFQNIRQMFELTKRNQNVQNSNNINNTTNNANNNINQKEREAQSPMILMPPPIMSASYNSALHSLNSNLSLHSGSNGNISRTPNSMKSINEIKTPMTMANVAAIQNAALRASATSIQSVANSPSIATSYQQQAQPQTRSVAQTQQRSASGLSQMQQNDSESADQATNLIRPIAFKPIPFEPDYSISSRYTDVDRYGSTPSLVPVQGSNMRFGSTTDLRHGGGSNVGGVGVGSFIIGNSVGNVYSSNNYCNSLMARRRGSRSLKINDSMESIRHTPDSDANSQSSTIKSNCSINNNNNNNNNNINNSCNNNNHHHYNNVNNSNNTINGINNNTSNNNNINNHINNNNNNIIMNNNNNLNNMNNNNNNTKFSINEHMSDMTPSPSDSGISELEAALKDRDSELSYLRQTMEHNEKVIFKVQKDKETFWENELKRLKNFYEGQQREYLLKMKKMEQMLAMQQFQMKQHKLRHNEQTNKLREQLSDLKNENEILRSNSSSLKSSERNLKDRTAFIEEQLEKSENLIQNLKSQLEESEWKVCERNGEIALLKTQLKEANLEITMKEHAIVHLRQENTNVESQIYQSLQENHNLTQHQKQIEEQKAQNDHQTETELKQMNKIIILKDQVILALTNELAKLRKELSDLAISHEYGEEPSGKFTRLKQQLDSLSEICQKTRKQAKNSQRQAKAENESDIVDAANIELIMNCLKLAPASSDSDDEKEVKNLKADERLAKMSADIQKFVYGSQNLPDIAINTKPVVQKFEEADLDTLIKESANYAEEIAKLRQQLDNVRVNFELEKQQWCEEKEKVLSYQKQLQAHYINMYQKLKSLENSCLEN